MYKFSLLISFFLFSTLSIFAQNPDLYIIAKSGLKLREAASLTANPIQTVAMGEKVKWISTDYKKSVSVEGINGYMAKVQYAGKTGYMFDGFLAVNSPNNPLEIKQKMLVIKDIDDIELKKMSATMSAEDGGEAASDIGFYRMTAIDMLEKYHIPYFTTNMRFIQFLKSDGTTEMIDTYKMAEYDVFMFDGTNIKPLNTVDFSATEEGKKPDFLNFMN